MTRKEVSIGKAVGTERRVLVMGRAAEAVPATEKPEEVVLTTEKATEAVLAAAKAVEEFPVTSKTVLEKVTEKAAMKGTVVPMMEMVEAIPGTEREALVREKVVAVTEETVEVVLGRVLGIEEITERVVEAGPGTEKAVAVTGNVAEAVQATVAEAVPAKVAEAVPAKVAGAVPVMEKQAETVPGRERELLGRENSAIFAQNAEVVPGTVLREAVSKVAEAGPGTKRRVA